MIITRTPFRVSFAGGGSDMATFYKKHEGAVLSTAINKYMYIMVHPTFDRKETIIKYRKTEIVDNVKKISHPIARQILMDYGVSGIEVASIADIPAGTGLASSSAYTVGLLNAMNAYTGKYRSQNWLGERACQLEIEELGEPIGKQDQFGCACEGIKFIRFLNNGEVNVTPIYLNKPFREKLEGNLLMFYTGGVRSASEILKEQSQNINESDKYNNLIKMTELAYQLKESLENEDLNSFGEILHKGWLLKKELASKITNSEIDKYYDIAIKNGATGGKLLGAGSGGFLLLYCEKEKQSRLRSALFELDELEFKFDLEGSKVIHVGVKNW